MNKKIILFGFLLVLLIAIPLTVWLVSTQTTNNRTKAEKATTLTLVGPSDPVSVGQSFNVGIQLAPGTNQVSFIKLVVQYNKQKLQRGDPGITLDAKFFPVTLEGPTYDQCQGDLCTTTIAVSIGTQTDLIIPPGSAATQIGNLSFKALAPTDNGSTTISFTGGTQALSLASGDQASENVLQTPSPLTVLITGVPTPTLTPDNTVPTTPPSNNGGGGGTNNGGGSSDSGGSSGGESPGITNTPTPSGGGSAGTNQAPTCTSLGASVTSGSIPLTVQLTATGADSDGTISKVTFNFGDGAVQDVTSGNGIGSASVNAPVSHNYTTAGTYTATATFTDNNGTVSNPSSCSKTITAGAAQPSPTIPATGPGTTIVGVGIAGMVIAVLGAIFVFGL